MRGLHFEDDTREKIPHIITQRLPWLVVGLMGGMLTTVIISNFEQILSRNIALAFSLPVIVYMSDAIGTQTETVYVRSLSKRIDHFGIYLLKEMLTGICFGLIFGTLIGLFAKIWLGSTEVAITVGFAMFVNAMIAPVLALIVPEIMFKRHADPALGAGPFTTIIQDFISLLIYLMVATLIIL